MLGEVHNNVGPSYGQTNRAQVAPSLWTVGIDKAWPAGGEIDIIEGRNDAPFNQMALHTSSGCRQAASVSQTGNTSQADCAAADGRGCAVVETKNSSYGAGFAAANGGVFAVQFDSPGISIWFWSVCPFIFVTSH